jgi:hypothetical protein
MALKKTAFLALALIVFAAGFTALLMAQRDKPRAARPAAVQAPIEGKLDIRAIDDLRVGGAKILLCGVSATRPRAMRGLLTEAARRDYQGRPVSCRRIGAGTPCDGNVAAKFGDATVVQCLTAEGVDIAAAFSAAGYLCDVPGQSGGAYTACAQR